MMSAVIQLKFVSPNKLNIFNGSNDGSNVSLQEIQWTYGGNVEYPLSLDTEKWTICSNVNGKVEHISKWFVNEENNAMVLSGEADDSYKKIEFAFAVSMLGQIVNRNDLIRYLSSLQAAFAIDSNDSKTELKQENNETSNKS